MNDCERLVKEFCALADLRDHAANASGAPIEVNGVNCSITAGRQNEANAAEKAVEWRQTFVLNSPEIRAPGSGLPASGGARALLDGERARGVAKTAPR